MKTKKAISVDGTGRGQCRIPAGWQLYYWDDQDNFSGGILEWSVR